ncbi:MAG: glycoside hydrolase family 3 C-terminal domain-containing protein [Phycisphaerales bacterium]|nr:glycoside hydrolase family 3 C-terminal domain-containing protein [Phycisphaerales bacterium]
MSPFKNLIAATAILLMLSARTSGDSTSPPPHQARIAELLARMSLQEKIGQLNMRGGGQPMDVNPGMRDQNLNELLGEIRSGAVGSLLGANGADYINKLQRCAVEESPHKIPLLVGNDVIHGFRTIFPIPLGEAATFQPELIERAATVAAREARAAGTNWTFAPMIDVCRDARWGRIAETAGEDHYLGALMAAARVRGFQGDRVDAPDRVLACGKHYVAYGAPEGGRDYNTVDVSMQTLHEVHLATFHTAVRAGVASMMTSFNEINGVPASGNEYVMRTVLRGDWAFGGFVVSDYNAIPEMILHGYAADRADAAAKALRAGVDIDMCGFAYRDELAGLVASGRVSEKLIDESVNRVLRAKASLGLFESPYSDSSLEKRTLLAAEHRALARDIARRSMVLLKNNKELLPLPKSIKRLALIGPLIDSRRDPLGTWACYGEDQNVVTVRAGLAAALPQTEILTARGCDVRGESPFGVDEAVVAANAAEAVVLVLGESEDMSGEGHSRASIELPAPQLALAKSLFDTGKPCVVVLLTGRPLAIPTLAESAGAILCAWHPGTECGHAIADVLLGDFNPAGRLPATFPRATGQIPIHYNHKNTGRPPTADRYTSKYIDVAWTPQYSFGFGLSYTTFAYSDLRVEPATVDADGSIRISVNVANTGRRDGEEVVQVYFRDPIASRTRPVRQLCAFERVAIAVGQSKCVEFSISADLFAFYNWDMKRVVEPGEIELYVGGNPADGLKTSVQVIDAIAR